MQSHQVLSSSTCEWWMQNELTLYHKQKLLSFLTNEILMFAHIHMSDKANNSHYLKNCRGKWKENFEFHMRQKMKIYFIYNKKCFAYKIIIIIKKHEVFNRKIFEN